MEYQYRPSNESQGFRENNESVASDRLRKAIERNRARQSMREEAPRENVRIQTERRPEQNSYNQNYNPNYNQNTNFKQNVNQNQGAQSFRQAPPVSPFSNTNQRQTNQNTTTTNVRQGFRGVEDIGFSTEIKRERRVPGANVEYIAPVKERALVPSTRVVTTSTSKLTRAEKAKYIRWAVNASWMFSLLLFFRLIFASRGVIDYYSHYKQLKSKQGVLASIEKENLLGIKEIEKIKSDNSYQKRIIRDNLGYIASDEYMVLFSKDLASKSR